jgi:hypothetical protein
LNSVTQGTRTSRDILAAAGQDLGLRAPGGQHRAHPLVRFDRDDPRRPPDQLPGHGAGSGREVEDRPRA